MTTQAIKLMTFGMFGKTFESHRSGAVRKGRTEVLKGLGGSQVRCTSGTLWLTIQGDPKDYVLTQNQALTIPNPGKVLLSGSGTYQA